MKFFKWIKDLFTAPGPGGFSDIDAAPAEWAEWEKSHAPMVIMVGNTPIVFK